MIEWKVTFPEQVRAMSDEELRRAFEISSNEAGDPVADAYAAELERRRLTPAHAH